MRLGVTADRPGRGVRAPPSGPRPPRARPHEGPRHRPRRARSSTGGPSRRGRLGLVDPWELIGLLEGRVARRRPATPVARRRPVRRVGPRRRRSLRSGRPPDRRGHACAVVVGVVANPLPGRTSWAERVLIAGDPVRSMGSLGEPECRRIIAAIDLAARARAPGRVDLPVVRVRASRWTRAPRTWTGPRRCSAGSSTFTEAGGEIDVVVAGVNVGAQSYWNAEATMLMHTRGLLVMVPGASMVLTGRKALEFSGSVGAEDEVGIGGFDRVMGPNGQAQYRADDLAGAYAILFDHYARTYPEPDRPADRRCSRRPTRSTATSASSPYKGDDGFSTVGRGLRPRASTPAASARSPSARSWARSSMPTPSSRSGGGRWPTPTRPWCGSPASAGTP